MSTRPLSPTEYEEIRTTVEANREATEASPIVQKVRRLARQITDDKAKAELLAEVLSEYTGAEELKDDLFYCFYYFSVWPGKSFAESERMAHRLHRNIERAEEFLEAEQEADSEALFQAMFATA